MPRIARIAVAGLPHHIIQRGNNRQATFVDEQDYQRYLATLREYAQKLGLAIHAYVLMPNHVHLLATPQQADSLSKTMQNLGRSYVRYFNDRHARTGTLWEGRFRSSAVETDRYFLACARYIELNPVRAGITPDPASFRWSSYRHHVGLELDALLAEHATLWALGNTPFERQSAYRRLFEQPLSQDELHSLRHAVNRGWVTASATYAQQLNETLARKVTPASVGRPRRKG